MKRGSGFSLIEVMIVLAILSVLAVIAYPAYAGYVTKSRRIEGQMALIDALQQQERFYSAHHTYIAFSSASTDPEAMRFKWWSGSAAARSAYELRAYACPGHELNECVEVKALPGTTNVDARFRDTECETLSLNSAGERGATGPKEGCWP